MGDAFPISGNIDAAAFPFLLVSLHQQGATGSLKVDGPSYQKALYFRAGRILFGSSNDPRDQLGSILIESGRISPEQLEDVNGKVGPGNPLAKVLADSGFVSQRELSEAARAKVELIVSDIMAYDSGSFEFEDGVLPKGAIDLKLNTEKLFVAAARRVTARGFVLRHLDGLDAVLVPTDDRARLDELRSECGGLIENLDGHRSLKDCAELTPLDEFEAGKIACGLMFLGVVRKLGAAQGATSDEALAQAAQAAFQPDDAAAPEGLDAPFFLDSPSFGLDAPPPFEMPRTGAAAASATSAPFALPETEEALPATLVMPKAVSPEPITSSRPAQRPPQPPPAATPDPPPSRPPVPSMTPGGSKLPLIPPPPRRPARPVPNAEEPELPLSRPSAPPPSRADLAAVDALLNSRGIEPPLSGSTRPTPRPAPHWEPRFGQQAARGPRPRGGPSPALIGAILVLLGIAGASAWYVWLRPAAGKPAVASASPTATPATEVPPSTLAPATPEPTPGATPEPSAPQATPSAPPVPDSTPTSVDEARAALRRGAVGTAARGFALVLRKAPRGTHTIQLLVACSEETVTKATQAVPGDELFVVPVTLTGRACNRMCWGIYQTAAGAQSALGTVPAYFREGGANPKVLPTTEILP